MSRIGKLQIAIPAGVEVKRDEKSNIVTVKGPKGELQQYVDANKAQTYRHAAEQMLTDLSSDKYQSRDRNVAFLMHSTGHHPAGSEIDASIIYADYYYIEALLRLKELSR